MTTLHRRDLLGTVALVGVATLTPTVHAQTGPLDRRVLQLRHRWHAGTQDIEEHHFVDRLGPEHVAARQTAHELARGTGALDVPRGLHSVELEDQAHPGIQGLIREVLQALGTVGVSCKGLITGFVDGPGKTDTGEVHLRAALRTMRVGLSDWKTTVGRQRVLEGTLRDLVHDETPGALRRKARKQARQIERLEGLARQLADDPTRSGLL